MSYFMPTNRGSGRVESSPSNYAGQRAVSRFSAPEASAAGAAEAGAASAPEGGRGQRAARRSGQFGRTGAQQLAVIRSALSDRDCAVLASLTAHPFLTTNHIQRLHFADHASDSTGGRVCRRVLARLAEFRAIQHLERRIGGVRAGSASFVWRLGPVGERLLQLTAADNGRPRLRRKEPSLHYLDHSLAVAETHLRLLEAGRAHSFHLLRVQTEPTCWRSFVSLGGGLAVLKPDLYAVTATSEYEDSWFIEVDRGTESLPTLLRKCRVYEEYRRSGVEQRTHDVFPLVLWLLPNQPRLDTLSTALHQAPDLDAALYRLTTFGGIIPVVTGGGS